MNLITKYTPDIKRSQALAHFDGLKQRFVTDEEINHEEKLSLVAHARISSSNSLKRRDEKELERWNLAQWRVLSSPEKELSWELVLEVNSLLTGREVKDCQREGDIFAGGVAFMDNSKKNEELHIFKNEVLINLHHLHPIVASTLLRFWIVSLHPFKDGNGRTAQTIGDGWLLKFNYPPLVFFNPYEGQFAVMPKIRNNFIFEDALESSFIGLTNAFDLIFRK